MSPTPILLLALTLALTFALTAAPTAADPEKTLKRCISLDRKIERYTGMRRRGGSAAQMDRWRDTRHRAQVEYRRLRCHKFGRKLRRRD